MLPIWMLWIPLGFIMFLPIHHYFRECRIQDEDRKRRQEVEDRYYGRYK